LTIAREFGEREGEGVALSNLGLAYSNLGNQQMTISLNEQRLEISCEIGDQHGSSVALSNMGNAYCQLGDFVRAIEFYKKVSKLTVSSVIAKVKENN